MKYKRILCLLFALAMFLCATTAYADWNLGSEDAAELMDAIEGYVWNGSDAGLRVTIYDAETENKVFKTIDISGRRSISTNDRYYFAETSGGDYIPKTSWLDNDYVGSTYNSLDANSKTRFKNFIGSKVQTELYKYSYVSQLSGITIISENNTENLEKIRETLGEEFFLKNLCDLIDGLEYDDISQGKYKIAFEPVAYLRLAGQEWAATATELGILNQFFKWSGSTTTWGPLVSFMGNLTHSQVPLSAFLEENELGVEAFEDKPGDYNTIRFNSGRIGKRYKDNCIIGRMGIGVLSGAGSPPIPQDITSESSAEYHTDTNVYISFNFKNKSGTDIIGDETKDDNISSLDVLISNPDYEENGFGEAPYISLGSYSNGYFSKAQSDEFSYTITSGGTTLKSGSVSFSCPDDEEAMGWIEWHTPRTAQDVTITISSNNYGVYILDSSGAECTTLTISASVSKLAEKTPPDPKVTDKKPTWFTSYTSNSVLSSVSQYAPLDGESQLSWYIWTYDLPASGDEIDNTYFNSQEDKDNENLSGSTYDSAAILSGATKDTCTVKLSADIKILPSMRCYTAIKNNATGKYTMKSGYGIQIAITPHLNGDTYYCTSAQTANVLFPEFNYNKRAASAYNRLLEKSGNSFVFKTNEYSTYNDRVHFTPIWYPDNTKYTVYGEVLDVWCPAGQLSVRLTDYMTIKGNVYDDWHVAPGKP